VILASFANSSPVKVAALTGRAPQRLMAMAAKLTKRLMIDPVLLEVAIMNGLMRFYNGTIRLLVTLSVKVADDLSDKFLNTLK
jgi:hypothetical protein